MREIDGEKSVVEKSVGWSRSRGMVQISPRFYLPEPKMTNDRFVETLLPVVDCLLKLSYGLLISIGCASA